jgi:hypothetical protein
MTTLSPQAALSILIPINLEQAKTSIPNSPDSLSSISIQSDDENDREVTSKRLSRYIPETPKSIAAVVRPQFSCPDFAMGTARSMKTRMKDQENIPSVPSIPQIHLQRDPSHVDITTLLETGQHPHKIRKQNSFVQFTTTEKRTYADTFGEDPVSPRKRHGGAFLRRLQGYFVPGYVADG